MILDKKYIAPILSLISVGIIYKILDSAFFFYCYNIHFIVLCIAPFIFLAFYRVDYSKLSLKNWPKIVLSFVFVLLISLPLIQQLTHFAEIGIEENFEEKRQLADFPKFSVDSLMVWPDKYTAYYNDNFGFRRSLITYNNGIKMKYFGAVISKPYVTLGKDDWMFYTPQPSLDDHLGKYRFSEVELADIKTTLLERQKYLAEKGIAYYVVIAPDNMSVYKEFFPDHLHLTDTTNLDRVLSLMSGSGLKMLDLRPTLIEAKKYDLVFQKNDSHWNENGGFAAYRGIMKFLSKEYPMLNVYDKNDFDIITHDKEAGDLAMMLGVRPFYSNNWFEYVPKENVRKSERLYEAPYEGIYDAGYKSTFLMETADKQLPRVVFFNDSYISYIYPFLSHHFSRSVFFWMYDFKRDFVEREHPDIVISFIAERSLIELSRK